MPGQLRSLLDNRVGAAATFRLLLAEQRQTDQGPDFFHFTRVMERRPRCSVRSAVLGLNTSLSGNSIGHTGATAGMDGRARASGTGDCRASPISGGGIGRLAHTRRRAHGVLHGVRPLSRELAMKSAQRKQGIYSKRYGSWNCGPELLGRLTPLLSGATGRSRPTGATADPAERSRQREGE